MQVEFNMVKDFHRAFGHPIADAPISLNTKRCKSRAKWMYEEIEEFLESKDDLVNQIDSMIDLIYFALGTLVEMGVEPDEVFKVVHDANMEKLQGGKIVKGEDGKILKPKNWIPPQDRIAELIKGVTPV